MTENLYTMPLFAADTTTNKSLAKLQQTAETAESTTASGNVLKNDHNAMIISDAEQTTNDLVSSTAMEAADSVNTISETVAAAATVVQANAATPTSSSSNKTLKRCLSVPTLPPGKAMLFNTINTRSVTAAKAANKAAAYNMEHGQETPKKHQQPQKFKLFDCSNNGFMGVPRSNPNSREVSPAPAFNIFAPRARRYSASYSPHATMTGAPLCLTPRVSQLRQEESVDINSREVNHEREVHSALQISQSWEDLTLVTEGWSCKSDDASNPLQVLPPTTMAASCSSPSPTSTRATMRPLICGLSPSPTRRTFATRRSMSPIAMRPSALGPVKRKFELDDNCSNWNIYSPPPLKKILSESRGSSPVYQSNSSVCASPDSGRTTPKLFISKLCTNSHANSHSACSSPNSSVNNNNNGATLLCAANMPNNNNNGNTVVEPMCISSSVDEGISISESEEKMQCSSSQPLTANDMQDDSTLMDDTKSETSSIGACSSFSIESSSCDSGTKAITSFQSRLINDDAMVAHVTTTSSSLGYKNFFINKQGLSGAKKFIVNHDNLPNSSNSSSSCTTPTSSIVSDLLENVARKPITAANAIAAIVVPGVVVVEQNESVMIHSDL